MDNNITSLYIACEERNIKEIKSILSTCNKIDEEAYFLVCSNGDIEILELILQNSIHNNKLDIHVNNEYALNIACIHNRLDVIDYLIKFGEEYNNKFSVYLNENELIKIAIKYNCIEIVKYLCDYSIKYNIPFDLSDINILYIISEKDNIDLLKYVIEYQKIYDKDVYSSILKKIIVFSCEYNSINIIKYILSNKYINKNYEYTQCLASICLNNDTTILKLLIEYFEIDIKHYIYLLLRFSYENNSTHIIKYLFDYAEKNNIIIDTNKTNFDAIIMECRLGNIEAVQELSGFIKSQPTVIINNILRSTSNYNYECFKYILDYVQKNNICEINYNYLIKSLYNLENMKLLLNININIPYDIHVFDSHCSCGKYEIFKLLFEYFNKHNNIIDLYYDNFILLTKACIGKNIDLIHFLLHFEQHKSNKILQYIINNPTYNNQPLLNACTSNDINIINYIIKYCFEYNIIIDISTLIQYMLRCSIFNNHTNVATYLIYLYKHNYNKYHTILKFTYCNLYTPSNNSDLFFMSKNLNIQYKHKYSYLTYNNLNSCNNLQEIIDCNYTFYIL